MQIAIPAMISESVFWAARPIITPPTPRAVINSQSAAVWSQNSQEVLLWQENRKPAEKCIVYSELIGGLFLPDHFGAP